MQPDSTRPPSIITHTYTIPVADQGLLDPVITAASLNQLSSLDERLQQYETEYQAEKKMRLEALDSQIEQQKKDHHEAFYQIIGDETAKLKQQADSYFSAIEEHCSAICQTVLKRLHVGIKDIDKTRATVTELIHQYNNSEQAELHLPEECYVTIENNDDIPKSWTIISDKTLSAGMCRLELGFGNVVGNFDQSYHSLIDNSFKE